MASKKTVRIKDLLIGGGNRIAIQSMLNADTADKQAVLAQTAALKACGCDIVRFAVRNQGDIDTIRFLNDNIDMPLVADIQFDYKLAIASVEAGIHKIRYNPGNIGDRSKAKELAEVCGKHSVPIRIGVNSGSIDKELLIKHGNTAYALFCSIREHVKVLNDCGFEDIVLSAKSSSVAKTIEVNRMLNDDFDYPLHIGVTESGSDASGIIKSAIGIGSLLCDGIGDTIRVSLTSDPIKEVLRAKQILRAAGVDKNYAEVVSCPTCARCSLDLEGIVRIVEERVKNVSKPLKIAIMGCAVNGPGEAKDADFGIAGGEGKAVFFEKGKVTATLSEEEMLPALLRLIDKAVGD